MSTGGVPLLLGAEVVTTPADPEGIWILLFSETPLGGEKHPGRMLES